MMNNNLLKKTCITILTTLLLLMALITVFASVLTTDIAYAAANEDIYYSDDGYSDNGELTTVTETITYTTKEASPIYRVNNTFPAYYNKNDSLTNVCANVAGANIIGYYDRYYENLISDYVPGIKRGSNYTYYPMSTNSSKIQSLIEEMYTRMGTNVQNAGTTQDEYKSGITSYVNSRGYSVTYNSVMNGTHLDINKVLQAINNGDPVSLYLSGYNITSINDTGTSVNLQKAVYTGNHIMIVYGYQTIDYYDNNHNLIKSNTYLYVATGTTKTGYYVLNNNGTINNAEAVHIS